MTPAESIVDAAGKVSRKFYRRRQELWEGLEMTEAIEEEDEEDSFILAPEPVTVICSCGETLTFHGEVECKCGRLHLAMVRLPQS